MKRYIYFIAILCLMSVLASDQRLNRFLWLNNLDQARSIALQQKKPLLIIFRCEP